MLRPAFIALIALSFGCSGQTKSDPLIGTYEGWMFIDGRAVGSDGSMGMTQQLTLEPGSKYAFNVEASVMMSLSIHAEGTYVRVGDELKLTGTQTSKMDDGYKRGTETGPHEMKLKVVEGMLEMTDGKGDPFYYRKEGTGPPPLPSKLKLKESETAAVKLIKKIEETHASLKSCKVTGTVKSQGGGFVAKDAKFMLLFQSPSKFRFESTVIEGSIGDSDVNEITWDGGPKCWWYAKEFGEIRDRSLGNALSIVAVSAGPQANLLPSLLLPEILGNGIRYQYPEATLLSDEKIGGRVCAVLQLKSGGADVTKLWVEKSSGMILRLYEELRDVTVNFDPHPNVAIDPKEFMLGRRSRQGEK